MGRKCGVGSRDVLPLNDRVKLLLASLCNQGCSVCPGG